MTPQTLLIDRNFKGVGRIHRATGTTNPRMRRKLSDMLTSLHESARLDVLRAIRDGQLTMLQVYDAYQRRDLDSLPLAGTMRPLHETMAKWIESADVSPHHATMLGQALKYFDATMPGAKIGDLPAILETLRDSLGVKHPRSFNYCRVAASRFVRALFKRSHPLYGAITDVEPRVVKAKRKRKPLSVQQMRNLFPNIHDSHDDAIAWGIVTTGMRPVEYWGAWSVEADRVVIGSAKQRQTRRAERAVPLIIAPAVPRVHRRTWENHIRDRGLGITPYDLRRTYANWLEAAGISRTRRKLYLGHSAGDVTGLYELHEVDTFLADDAKKLRDFVNVATEPALRLASNAD